MTLLVVGGSEWSPSPPLLEPADDCLQWIDDVQWRSLEPQLALADVQLLVEALWISADTKHRDILTLWKPKAQNEHYAVALRHWLRTENWFDVLCRPLVNPSTKMFTLSPANCIEHFFSLIFNNRLTYHHSDIRINC